MAISRHDEEWKRTIATAALAGVRFQQISSQDYGRRPQTRLIWQAWIPVQGISISFTAHSKVAAARKALEFLNNYAPFTAAVTEEKTACHGNEGKNRA